MQHSYSMLAPWPRCLFLIALVSAKNLSISVDLAVWRLKNRVFLAKNRAYNTSNHVLCSIGTNYMYGENRKAVANEILR